MLWLIVSATAVPPPLLPPLSPPAEPGGPPPPPPQPILPGWDVGPGWLPQKSEASIYPERYSPTTDIISFSPSTWPMQMMHPWAPKVPEGWPWVQGSKIVNPTMFGLHSMMLLQRACKLDMAEPQSCYLPLDPSPFDHVSSNSSDARFTFIRNVGFERDGEYKKPGNQCAFGPVSNDGTKYGPPYGAHSGLVPAWCPAMQNVSDIQCGQYTASCSTPPSEHNKWYEEPYFDHDSVDCWGPTSTVETCPSYGETVDLWQGAQGWVGVPNLCPKLLGVTLNQMCGRGQKNGTANGHSCTNGGYDEPTASVKGMYGAYYHMADTLYPEVCRWTPSPDDQASGYIREAPLRTNNLDESYDYSYEVCQRRGDCSADDANCINAYTAVFLGNLQYVSAESLLKVKPPNFSTNELIPYPPRQYPAMGAGRIDAVFATPANGPHLPCAVDENGAQIPCSVPVTEYSGHPSLNNSEPEQDLAIHISRLKVNSVNAISSEHFTVVVEVTTTWTSKYAVHPCGIDLYRGVVAGRANVPAEDWWRPVVKADGAASSVESFVSGHRMLQVYNTAGNATHEPEPVTQPCAPPGTAAQEGTCPWRQQVFLQQHVLLEMDFKSHFNLNRFPFDTQTLTGSFFLADKFDGLDKASRTSISFDSPGYSDAGLEGSDLASIYTKPDWIPRSAVIRPSTSASPGTNCRKERSVHLCADFEIRIQRDATGNVFRVLVPAFVQMGLTTLAALQPAATRLQVLALGAVATVALLQPLSLGLPASVHGVPFALIICQIAVVGLMLVVTGYQLVLTAGVGRRTGDLCSSRRAAVVGEWKAAFVAKRALEEQLPGGAPQPAASADVSLSLSTGEPLGVGKPAAGKPFAGDPPAGSSPPAEPVSLLTRAVLALPALMHHASQSTLPKPTHPHGEGTMAGSDWVRAEDRALLCRSAKIDTRMALLLPPLYVLLTSILLGLYWGGAMD